MEGIRRLAVGFVACFLALSSDAQANMQHCAEKPSGPCIARVSWYGKEFHGRRMANGQKFDAHDPTTVAHKHLPFGTRLGLVNPETGRSIEVVVRDRGPYVGRRQLDLSYAAAKKLGFLHEGHAELMVKYVVVPASKRK